MSWRRRRRDEAPTTVDAPSPQWETGDPEVPIGLGDSPSPPSPQADHKRTKKPIPAWLIIGLAMIVVVGLVVAAFGPPWKTNEGFSASAPSQLLSERRTEVIAAAKDVCTTAQSKADTKAARREREWSVDQAQGRLMQALASYKQAYYRPDQSRTRRQSRFDLAVVVRSARGRCADTKAMAAILTTGR